nr:hypothetical protein TorRG33x02_136430 [Ipomoea batatas]
MVQMWRIWDYRIQRIPQHFPVDFTVFQFRGPVCPRHVKNMRDITQHRQLGIGIFLVGNIALDIVYWMIRVPGGSGAAGYAVNFPWAAGGVGEREDLGEAVADNPEMLPFEHISIADVESFVLGGWVHRCPDFLLCNQIRVGAIGVAVPRRFKPAGESQRGSLVATNGGVDAEGSDGVHQAANMIQIWRIWDYRIQHIPQHFPVDFTVFQLRGSVCPRHVKNMRDVTQHRQLGIGIFLVGNIALDILDRVVGVPDGSGAAGYAVNFPGAAGGVSEREDLGEAVADNPGDAHD